MEIRKRVNFKCVCKAVSLESRSLAALYPPPVYYFQTDTIERGVNDVGIIIPPPATSESGDQVRSSRSQPYKAHFCIKKTQVEFSTKVVKLRFKPLKSISSRSKGNPHLFLTPSFPFTLSQKSEVEAALMLFS